MLSEGGGEYVGFCTAGHCFMFSMILQRPSTLKSLSTTRHRSATPSPRPLTGGRAFSWARSGMFEHGKQIKSLPACCMSTHVPHFLSDPVTRHGPRTWSVARGTATTMVCQCNKHACTPCGWLDTAGESFPKDKVQTMRPYNPLRANCRHY